MWAETINLSIGQWNLGVRPDSERTASVLRALLAHYLCETGPRLPSNFSIRRPYGFMHAHRGAVYIGGVVVGRSRRFATLVRLLAGHLAGLEPHREGLTRVQLRAFVKGDQVVLVELPRPALVDDALLHREGITEQPIWVPAIDPIRQMLVVPQPLYHVHWRAAGIRAPHNLRTELKIMGVVMSTNDGPMGAVHEWTQCLSQLRAVGRLVTGNDAEDARHEIVNLLTT